MPKKTEKRVKAWAVLIWGEMQNPARYIFQFKADAQKKRRELIEDEQHCGTCECEGLDPKEVSVVPCTITYSLPSQGKGKKK